MTNQELLASLNADIEYGAKILMPAGIEASHIREKWRTRLRNPGISQEVQLTAALIKLADAVVAKAIVEWTIDRDSRNQEMEIQNHE